MNWTSARDRQRPPDRDSPPSSGGFVEAARLLLDDALGAFAITAGPTHAVVYANPAMLGLTGIAEEAAYGRPLPDFCSIPALPALLDRVFHEGHASIDELLVSGAGKATWGCSVWPLLDTGTHPYATVVELRALAPAHVSAELQRQVAARLLLSALREMDSAES